MTAFAVVLVVGALAALVWLAVGSEWDHSDPVDEHYLTAAALLAPDDPRLPHAADCDCAECTYAKFAAIIRDFYEEPTR